MKTFAQLYGISLLLAICVSCDRPPNQEDIFPKPEPTPEFAVICNEGNFQSGNATATHYNFATDKLTPDFFGSVNKKPLGDVLQSATLVGDEMYLVVNNSQKIEVVGRDDLVSRRTITGFHSPRYLLALNENQGFVSEYYDNSIKLIQLKNGSILKKIDCPGWHDQMVLINNKLYVSTTNREELYVIDALNHNIIKSIAIAKGCSDIVFDKFNRIWALCAVPGATNQNASLYCIDTQADTIIRQFRLPDVEASRLIINGTRDKLYWISTHIFEMDVTSTALPVSPFIVSVNTNFYALGYNSYRNEIWASDALDYVQNSTIFRYSSQGANIGFFKAGINSGYFLFYKQ